MSSSQAVYKNLMEAGKEYGIINAGYKALDAMHYEKGYKVWTYDLTPDTTPLEGGMPWALKLKTDIDFKGRRALEQQQKEGLKKRFVTLVLDDAANAAGASFAGFETIYRNGRKAGYLTLGGFGHTVQKHIGLGYVNIDPTGAEGKSINKAWLESGKYEIEVNGTRYPATLHLEAIYDPKNIKIKA
eukprot:Opistho-2@69574